MDINLNIKIDTDMLQIRLRSTVRYLNPIKIHFKSTQIQSDWILDHMDLRLDPIYCHP